MLNITRKIKPFRLTLSQKFHEETKIVSSKKQLSYEKWPSEWKTVYFKGYPRFPAIKLPEPSLDNKVSLKNALFDRRSCRNFSGKTIKENELSTLLYFSAGIKEKNETWTGNRFYPSAGARYPLEVYPIIFNVDGIKSGIYHYYIKNHLLEILPNKLNYKQLTIKYFGDQKWVKRANMLIIISGIFYRTEVKYHERGYRHVLTETGYMTQNIYLLCSGLGLGCCLTGGFVDDGYNSLLDLNGVDESVVAVIAVGKK